MANITLRESTSLTSPGATVKGSPLTNNEVDNNFSNINIEHGVLSALTTGVKSNLVFAVNELKSNIGIGVSSVAGGTGSVSNNIILAGLLTVDGVGSTLDADTLDGLAGGGSGLYALKANNLSVFASTTSAQLAGIISDETGSGSLVFSASPTLTGNITVTGNINVSLDGVFTGNVSANDFISTSDRRLKENIETLEDPFLVLNQLEPVSYNWPALRQPPGSDAGTLPARGVQHRHQLPHLPPLH